MLVRTSKKNILRTSLTYYNLALSQITLNNEAIVFSDVRSGSGVARKYIRIVRVPAETHTRDAKISPITHVRVVRIWPQHSTESSGCQNQTSKSSWFNHNTSQSRQDIATTLHRLVRISPQHSTDSSEYRQNHTSALNCSPFSCFSRLPT